ncbi:MAG: hypothetical protein U0625_07035 [Phycisphaerales bacterium]
MIGTSLFYLVVVGALALAILGSTVGGIAWFIVWCVRDAKWSAGLALLLVMFAGLVLLSWAMRRARARWATAGFLLFAIPMFVGALPQAGESSPWSIEAAAGTCVASAIVAYVVWSFLRDHRGARAVEH